MQSLTKHLVITPLLLTSMLKIELDVNLTIFQRYAESEKKQNVTGFGSEYSANEEYWLRTNKSITITARNQH
jgi:hypothetical protein